MVRITRSGSQYRLTIPKEIMQATGWDENTELIFDPFTKEPGAEINNKTPILLKGVRGKR